MLNVSYHNSVTFLCEIGLLQRNRVRLVAGCLRSTRLANKFTRCTRKLPNSVFFPTSAKYDVRLSYKLQQIYWFASSTAKSWVNRIKGQGYSIRSVYFFRPINKNIFKGFFFLPCSRKLAPKAASLSAECDRRILCTSGRDLPVTGGTTCFFNIIIIIISKIYLVNINNENFSF